MDEILSGLTSRPEWEQYKTFIDDKTIEPFFHALAKLRSDSGVRSYFTRLIESSQKELVPLVKGFHPKLGEELEIVLKNFIHEPFADTLLRIHDLIMLYENDVLPILCGDNSTLLDDIKRITALLRKHVKNEISRENGLSTTTIVLISVFGTLGLIVLVSGGYFIYAKRFKASK